MMMVQPQKEEEEELTLRPARRLGPAAPSYTVDEPLFRPAGASDDDSDEGDFEAVGATVLGFFFGGGGR
jgi:hypothetical protein